MGYFLFFFFQAEDGIRDVGSSDVCSSDLGCACALRIQNLFRELRFPAEFLVTKNSEEIQSNVRQAIANKCKLLLAMGGDGTFQGLVNAAFGEDVVLGILPTGGGNDFAAALGLPGDPVIAARVVAGGQPRWVDLIRA